MKRFASCIVLLFLSCIQCRKDANELDKLPPITQNGSGTFGCLINGKAYTPKGYRNNPNFYVIVDPGFMDGDISIRSYRIKDGKHLSLSISSDSIKKEGTYLIKDKGRTQNRFTLSTTYLSFRYCDVYYGSIHQRKGFLKITKYDLVNGIVAGEFDISMVNKDCGYGDTIRITNGRFDFKL